MIWLTWRQFRVSSLVLLGAVAAAVLVLLVTRHQVVALAHANGQNFLEAFANDRTKTTLFTASMAMAYLLPAVVGIFWGAPMVTRELEAGTSRLVWTQSITRTRWLATKLGVAGACAAAVGVLGVVLTWWCGPIDDAVANRYRSTGLFAQPRLWPGQFGARGVVPIAMAVLALVIGVAVGLVIRRVLPAMAVTLALVIAVEVVMPMAVQAHLLPMKVVTEKLTPDNVTEVRGEGPPALGGDMSIAAIEISIGRPDAWITSNRTVDASGRVLDRYPAWVSDCVPGPRAAASEDAARACFQRLADEGYRQRVKYLPASSFWGLQLAETGVLLALTALLTGFCFWRIRRDLT